MKVLIVFGCEEDYVGETHDRFVTAMNVAVAEPTILILTQGGAAAMARALHLYFYHPAVAESPYETVIVEKRSRSTEENVRFSLRALKILGRRPEQFDEFILVSSWYHLPRIWLLWRLHQWGDLPIKLIPSWGLFKSIAINLLLEPLKYVFDLLERLDGWAGPHRTFTGLKNRFWH